jgi:phthiocerol/phenolphthiocerol synthesis type-I polyketide synthase D
MAVRAKNAVEADFGVPLPVRTLLQGATVDDFVEFLATELGLNLAEDTEERGKLIISGRDHTERLLRSLWEDVLGRDDVSVDDDFYALGGDQAAAEKVLELLAGRVEHSFDVETLFAVPTVEAQADLVRPVYESAATPLRVLRAEGDEPPLFLIHPAGGPASVYQELVTLLHPGQPAYGLERIDELRTIESKATRYIELIKEVQPRGPYRLGGWSLGGGIAYEMGRQLRAAGEPVDIVAMIDTLMPLPPPEGRTPEEIVVDRLLGFIDYLKDTYGVELEVPFDELFALDDLAQADLILKTMTDAGMGVSKGILQHQRDSYLDLRVAERYQVGPYEGRVVLYRATEAADVIAAQDPRYQRTDEYLGWDDWCSDLESVAIPGDHLTMIDRPNLDVLVNHLDGLLTELSTRRT